jgi:hypothetical protein
MGDAPAVAGPLLVLTQVAAQAAAETFKKSRRDRSFFILTSPFRLFDEQCKCWVPTHFGV